MSVRLACACPHDSTWFYLLARVTVKVTVYCNQSHVRQQQSAVVKSGVYCTYCNISTNRKLGLSAILNQFIIVEHNVNTFGLLGTSMLHFCPTGTYTECTLVNCVNGHTQAMYLTLVSVYHKECGKYGNLLQQYADYILLWRTASMLCWRLWNPQLLMISKL